MTDRTPAGEVIGRLVDGGAFEAWDRDVVSGDPLRFVDTAPYPQRLAHARASSGADEAVVCGKARLGGHEVVLVVGEFAFMAGSMGLAAAERIVRAFRRAGDQGLPVVGLPTSGGTRMQEGTLAFVQMATVAAAAKGHRDRGLAYLVYLRHPTTGGVLASWASLGQVTFAEPGALIGMTGPRVIEQLTGRPFPREVVTAEHLHALGHVDDVVAPDALAERLGRVLAVTHGPVEAWGSGHEPLELPPEAAVDPWAAVQRSRRVDRPGVRELLALCASHLTPLRGDGAGTEDAGCLAALARICGVPAVVIAHDRPPGERGASLGPAGYRKARRAMGLAEELGLPLVSVVDTPGAQMTPEAEAGGLGAELARCLATMMTLEVPTLSLLLGEGSGGGALALLPTDRVIAAEHAWLSPIAPEGASAILHRSTDRAPELAKAQAIASTDLRRLGLVDVVVPDRPQPGEEGPTFAGRIAATAARELRLLVVRDSDERRRGRAERYRHLEAAAEA